MTAFIAAAYLLPQELTRTDEPYATLVAASFFGRVLTFHFGLLGAGLAVAGFLLGRVRLGLCAILFSIAFLLPTVISLWPHPLTSASGPALRLMSMNLKYAQRDGELIVDQIRSFNPDVLVIEDYTPYVQSVLLEQIGPLYRHRYLLPNNLQGLAIFTRFDFVGGHPRTTFTKTRRQMRAVVDFGGRPVVIYVEHPFSPRSRRRILNNRLATVDLVNQVQSEKFPVILAGDFNFTTETPNEAALKNAGMQDAFERAGHGRGSTWPVEPPWMRWLPGVRIDHVFTSSQLCCTWFGVGGYDGSDHLPIEAVLQWSTGGR